MCGETSQERFNSAKTLLDYGFANYEFSTIEPQLKSNEIVVENGVEKSVKITAPQSFGVLLKKNEVSSVTQKINLPKSVRAPVCENDVLGSVDYYLNEQLIGSVDIKCAKTVDKINFFTAFLWILDGLLK